ncbi:DEAD/DEAH box helicase [Candidatus Hecatella orcuttiae]|uniref:DEAD/DEAH box helicase n=1 Tax=Candidatus Hecatella orcuttiae TaxID=1935119 RepID=UPI002867EBBC|nr:DEAD/DEAH box helicase [Candidatus Hecatella orcuttiae]
MLEHVTHPLLRPRTVERRSYQEAIAATCLRGNTLVILPTGLGKTTIAALTAAERLRLHPEGRCLILAPTKPLALQHYQTFRRVFNLEDSAFCLLTGENPPQERSTTSGRLIFMTPQVLENDLVAGRTTLRDVVLLVLDEAHRAVGNYAYVFIAKNYAEAARHPLVLGLTASPGSSRERIREVKENLGIRFVEARTDRSPDVKPYVMPTQVEWVRVQLTPPLEKIREKLQVFFREKVSALKEAGFLPTASRLHLKFRDISQAEEKLRKEIARQPSPLPELRRLLVDLHSARKASHALELLETQGLAALGEYFRLLETRARRAGAPASVRQMLLDGRIQEALSLTLVYGEKGVEHPKFGRLVETVERFLAQGARRVIVFTNYRETAERLRVRLGEKPGVRVAKLIGQANRQGERGLSQQKQTGVLAAFREGEFNVLVATQVAEEGLDISQADAVVFYDNIPSAIRFIQRLGRTGRRAPGKAVILLTEGTRDEAYHWIAKHKEKAMMEAVRELQMQGKEKRENGKQQELGKFMAAAASREEKEEGKLQVYVDTREASSPVVRELASFGLKLNLTSLEVGDYVLSQDTAVERKSVRDFAASIVDRRLFTQAERLASAYRKPLFIVEGEGLYQASGVSPPALRGAILSLIFDFRIPVLWTKTPGETALMIYSLAKREQAEKPVHISLREKKPPTLAEQQEYIIAGLPSVEATLARKLLAAFGSVEKVITAGEEELKKVRGIGPRIAEKIREVVTAKYPRSSEDAEEERGKNQAEAAED